MPRDKEKQKGYYNTPQEFKTHKIADWKRYGLIDDYEKVYEIYINTNNCMKCSVEISGHNKCMDHCHTTNLYRAVLCKSCNNGNPFDLHCRKTNKLGIKNIFIQGKGYRFQIQIKGTKHGKWFKTLEETIEYKNQYLLSLL